MSKVYAVLNNKGGVGKTTTAVNLAVGVAQVTRSWPSNPYVLLVDLDPQGNAADALGLRHRVWGDSYPGGACLSFVLEGAPAGSHVIPADSPTQKRPGLALLPASPRLKTVLMRLALESLASTLTGGRAGVQVDHLLEERLDATLGVFDYIILDCPPQLSVLQSAVYNFAQELIVPVQAQYLAVRGAQQHTAEIDEMIRAGNATARIAAIVPTMVDGRQVMARDTLTYLERTYGPATVADPIPNRVAVKEAPAAGLAVLEYDPEGDGAVAYRALVERLL